jgi:apolipoprotein N-acyltransferase
VQALTTEGKEPDVLINISSDSSFQYLSQIDMHLATHVFRAIENRKPYLSATNCGYSTWIDSTGKIIKQGENNIATFVVAEVHHNKSMSLYRLWGDWLPLCCDCFNGYIILWWLWHKRPYQIRKAV